MGERGGVYAGKIIFSHHMNENKLEIKNKKYKMEKSCLKVMKGSSMGWDPNQVNSIKRLIKNQNKIWLGK